LTITTSASTLEAERALSRIVGQRRGTASGPTLICVGSLHGNEPAGYRALQRVFATLEAKQIEIRGELLGLIGNRAALAAGKRFMVNDLNRIWSPARVQASREGQLAHSSVPEDRELDELRTELSAAFRRARETVYLVDLHTTSGDGPAFSVIADTLRNRSFALQFPVPIIVGLEEELGGTVTDYVGSRGHVTMGFEGGKHDAPSSIDLCEAAIWIALVSAGLLDASEVPDLGGARRLLRKVSQGVPRVFEVRHRQPVEPGDGFRMEPGFRSFQVIHKGQVLARDRKQVFRAREDGRILMPLYQEQGADGYFEVHHFSPFWLRVSGTLRRLRIDSVVHWLPGIQRHPESSDTLVVDQRVARFLSLELLHLLGFRRHRTAGRKLVMTRQQRDFPRDSDILPEP
jgi:Succinylglutamate desuccinylase / Aspartoacylase family